MQEVAQLLEAASIYEVQAASIYEVQAASIYEVQGFGPVTDSVA